MRQLDFTLSLIDKLTQPLASAKAAVSGFAKVSQTAFEKIAVGGAGLAGTFWSIKGGLDPAIQWDDAMTEASLQGVDSGVMAKVAADAMKFSSLYGKSSIEFVQSTAEISKKISELSQNDLPQMTNITNITAAALKSSAADTTKYMGQMFSNFSSHAKAVGNIQFAEELAGKAIIMSKTFGASMEEIADLMEGARAAGTHFGVGIDEQLAVLGELHRSLGTESSSVYESFLTDAAEGAKKLGISFVNASGHMLTLPEMLEKLQTKYGRNIEGNLKAQKEIEEAFGDSAIVVKQLYGNVDMLRKNISALGANDGLKRAREIAERMANPWARLHAIWQNIRIAVGSTVLPVISSRVNRLANAGQLLVRWLKLFSNIARWVGYITLSILSFAAAGAAANLVMGVSKFIWIGLKGIWAACTLVMKLGTAAVWLYNAAIIAWNTTLRVLHGVLLAVRMAAFLAGISFSFMTWPILLIIAAIALLAVGIYLLIRHWDAIKAAMMNTAVFKMVAAYVKWVGGIFSAVWDGIAEGWNNLCNGFSRFSLADTFSGIVESIGNIFGGLWDWLMKSFSDSYHWIIDKLNAIPGINIETQAIEKIVAEPMGKATAPNMGIGENPPKLMTQSKGIFQGQPKAMIQPVQAIKPPENERALTGGKKQGIGKHGMIKGITTHSQTINDNSRRIENVTLNISNGMTPEQLTEWEQVAHG
ncbi:phage tail tape measure protein [Photorhabdus sp. HUG-39]|uniref:Phage tail tape measure protein n=1 Tax=Photorhabdus kayaii TaxID=230088 RepID=A0ABX0B8L4_9GAMM|nr:MULTISPECIES: phage tail tape measure protein [Photorhabdus]MCC8375354.1 phage tail tape measure protein [Photorhabdus bodei]NDL13632.1 phage tail tape measure protein [Photorhabdus kayaii]NDL27192.1 phage tail tape measure protein [Photorhabdus kayaii]RAX07612.1 phage tail tape measure protein [Photorhabdus sp. HUG-39]